MAAAESKKKKDADKEKLLKKVEERVKNCKTCLGNPIKTAFNIPEYSGIKCDTCFEILDYNKK